MALLELYQSDDVTRVIDLANAAQAGQDGDILELHLWNHQGDPLGGQTVTNLLVAVRTESLTERDVWLAAGLPPQDELWWRWRIIGYDNRGDSSWSAAATDWQPLGAYSALAVSSIPPDCAVYFEAKRHPPSTAAAGSWKHQAVFYYDEFSQAIPHGLGLLRRGILTGIGNLEHSGIVFGCEVSVSATPDAEVHTAAGMWVCRGVQYGKVAEDHALDLTDGDGAALVSGESYWAVLTLGAGGVTLTRGSKAIDPQKPTLPASEPFLRWIRVEYDPSAAAVIDAGDLDGVTVYDRFHLEAGPGLAGTLHPGQGIALSTWRYRAITTPLVFSASATNYVWLLATGKPSVTTTAAAPETKALLLWQVTTDAVAIVGVVDRRTCATAYRVLELAGDLPAGGPGELDRLTLVDDHLFVERVTVDVPGLGGGTAGETVFDLTVNGASIYPSSATDDRRPRFAFDAAALSHQDSVPEVLELRRGDEVAFVTTDHADATPPRARVQIFAWVA